MAESVSSSPGLERSSSSKETRGVDPSTHAAAVFMVVGHHDGHATALDVGDQEKLGHFSFGVALAHAQKSS